MPNFKRGPLGKKARKFFSGHLYHDFTYHTVQPTDWKTDYCFEGRSLKLLERGEVKISCL